MPVTKFVANYGGLNNSSSPLNISPMQATGTSYNYDYARTGAITKVLGSRQVNSSPDAQLKTLGLGMYHNASTDVRTLLRSGGTKFQTVNTTTGVCSNISDDTVSAATDFFTSGSTQPVVFSGFNTLTGGTQSWCAGGGLTKVVGYTGSKITTNGVSAPGGSISPSVNSHNGGAFNPVGTYFYGLQFRKLSTQTFSNVALDASAVVVNTDDTVTISFASVTGIDTTLYDQIWVWRSAVGGSKNFTTGSIIAKLASNITTYTDTGTSLADSQNVARAGNTVLDNSQLPTGTAINCIATFKRRLVAAIGSTLYISDLNKPESWPGSTTGTGNTINIPTGGPIRALATIGVPSEYTTGADEYLVIFKERECWVLVGTSSSDWDLKQIDKTGCQSQSLVVPFNGFLAWIGINGAYIWSGRGRPVRISRPIYSLWSDDGDLSIPQLNQGYGFYYEQKNQVIWRLSHRTKGTNQFSLKLDVRLTADQVSQNFEGSDIDGVFISDTDSIAYYGLVSFRDSNFNEFAYAGDSLGNIYQTFNSASMAVSFDYETTSLDMDLPETNKRFKRVLVWVEKLTPNDITLYYWADRRIRDEYRSKETISLAPTKGTQPALWDIALWDQAYWDDYTPDISVIEFDLHANENNAEGDSLKLRFEQLEANAPVRIHAFAVDWEDLGPIHVPTSQVS